MADIQSLNFSIITTTTNYTNLNTISIINQSSSSLNILNTTSGIGNIILLEGQTLSLSATTGFVLPNLRLSSSGLVSASVITS